MYRILASLVLLSACSPNYEFAESTTALDLQVFSPSYGEFLGDSPVLIEGLVLPQEATLVVNGDPVDHQFSYFRIELPLDGDFMVVDIQADLVSQHQRIRIPVFSGHDPTDTWTGGITANLLPDGLSGLASTMATLVDAAGWADAIASSLPSWDAGWLAFTPSGLTHEPTLVELEASDGGITTTITLQQLYLSYDLQVSISSTYVVPLSIGFGEIAVSFLMDPEIDNDGLVWLSLSDASISLDEPDVDA